MCGIIGYSGKDPIFEAELKTLLLLAQSRGRDSTGVATPTEILKKAEKARDFVLRKLPTHNTVIGHTRAKTIGKVCDRNAHPFDIGGIKGVHNGGISNYWRLKRDENIEDLEVDSEIIWHMISKYGVEEGIPKLQGGMALGWIDEEEQLHLYRHSNPLYYGYQKENLYFGSLRRYLEYIGCKDIKSLEEHTEIIVVGGQIKETIDRKNCKPKSYTASRNNGWNNRNGYGGSHRNNSSNTRNGRSGRCQTKIKPHFAPDDANYVCTRQGYYLYYWFDNPTFEKLYVEPVYIGIPSKWKETYVLTTPVHVNELKNDYPDVYNQDEVKDVIETLNQK